MAMMGNTAMRFLLSLLALLWISAAHADPVYQSQAYVCDRAATLAGTAGATQIVATGATSQIYLCGFAFGATAAATVQFEYGTGTNCGTGTTIITPAFSLAANGVLVDHQSFYAGIPPVPNGNNLCVLVGGTGPAPGIVYYTQF